MRLTDLEAHLTAHPEDVLNLFGITAAEYAQLKVAFNATKKDRTSKIPEALKLLAIMLIHRFNLDNDTLRRLLYGIEKLSDVDMGTVQSFRTGVGARFNQACALQPAIATKLNFGELPLESSVARPLQIKSLEDMIRFMKVAVVSNSIVTHKARDINQLWISAYLSKKVIQKKSNGQKSLMHVFDCLSYDLDNNPPKDVYLAWQMATVFNFYAHNSSHASRNGYGMVPVREQQKPLFYARSQGKHTHGRLFRVLTSTNQTLQCLMPKNETLYRVIRTEYNGKFTQSLNYYDANGYKKANTPVEKKKDLAYFALQFSYSGLRKNVYAVTVAGILYSLNTHSAVETCKIVTESLFCKEQNESSLIKVKREILMRRNQRALSLLADVRNATREIKYQPNLYQRLTRYRRQNAQLIAAFAVDNRLDHLKVVYDRNTNTLDIRFYPLKVVPDNSNFTTGVTNVLINYFIGLLNAKLAHAGLYIHANRRQSFAFNRITITDTLNMTMRVSLGYEPSVFVTVFNECLQSFNTTLHECDFTNTENQLLATGFKVVENPRKGQDEEEAGSLFCNIMRSNDGQLKAAEAAEDAVLKNADRMTALITYINYITSDEFKAVKHFQQAIPQAAGRDIASTADNILVTGLLNNVLKYTMTLTAEAERIAETTAFSYSYVYHMGKLAKLSHKAQAWLISHTQYSSSHVYAKVILLVESILEHLTSLHTLLLQHDKPDLNSKNHIEKLAAFEESYVKSSLNLQPITVNTYFTDNGQQALTTSLVTMLMQVQAKDSVYVYDKCYYELLDNLKENLKIKPIDKPDQAEIIMVDVRNIDTFTRDIPKMQRARAVIMDCTHNPCLSDNEIKDSVTALLHKGIFVLLVGSMLKHEQLGMDKFQNGKIAVICPPGLDLLRNVRDELTGISAESMHPVAATYFTMMNMICQDKVPEILQAPKQVGLFNPAPVDQTHVALRPLPA